MVTHDLDWTPASYYLLLIGVAKGFLVGGECSEFAFVFQPLK